MLPKFEMKSFEGDPMRWKTFIETFEASINCSKDVNTNYIGEVTKRRTTTD